MQERTEHQLVFYRTRYHSEIERWVADNPSAVVCAVSLENRLPFGRLQERITFLKPWEYLEHDELLAIDRKALYLAKHWYRPGGKDVTAFRTISIGEIMEYEVMEYFVNCMKALSLLSTLIARENIRRVVLFGSASPYEKAALLFAQGNRVKTDLICAETKTNPPVQKSNVGNCLRQWVFAGVVKLHNFVRQSILSIDCETAGVAIECSHRTLPLIKRLMGQKELHVDLLLTGNLKDVFYDSFKNVKRVSLTNPFHLADSGNQNSCIHKLSQALEENLKVLLVQSNTPGLWEMVEQEIDDVARSWIARGMQLEATAAKCLANKRNRVLVVVHDFKGIQRALVATAKALGVRTMTLQHGAYGFYPLFVSPISNVVTVWGNEWSTWLTDRLAVAGDRVRVANDYFYDDYLEPDRASKGAFLRKRLRLPKGKRLILFVYEDNATISAFGFAMSHELLACNVCAALGNDGNLQLILKMRPDDPTEQGKEIVATANARNVVVVTRTNNLRLLQGVEVVLTRDSTMGFEAALLGVPVVAIDVPPHSGERDASVNPFLRNEFSIRVASIEEAVQITNRLLFDPEFRKRCRERQQNNLRKYLDRSADFVSLLKEQLLKDEATLLRECGEPCKQATGLG